MYPKRFRELIDTRATANTCDILFDTPMYAGGKTAWMAALTAEIIGASVQGYTLYITDSDKNSGVFISHSRAVGPNGRGDVEIAGLVADTKALVQWQEEAYRVVVCIGEVTIEASGSREIPDTTGIV